MHLNFQCLFKEQALITFPKAASEVYLYFNFQVAVLAFFKTIGTFDIETVKEKLVALQTTNEDYNKNIERIKKCFEEMKE